MVAAEALPAAGAAAAGEVAARPVARAVGPAAAGLRRAARAVMDSSFVSASAETSSRLPASGYGTDLGAVGRYRCLVEEPPRARRITRLSDGWWMRERDRDQPVDIDLLTVDGWLPASVPGTVHQDLMEPDGSPYPSWAPTRRPADGSASGTGSTAATSTARSCRRERPSTSASMASTPWRRCG